MPFKKPESQEHIIVPPGGRYVGPGSGGGEGGTYVSAKEKIISAGRGSTVGSSSPEYSGYHGGYQEEGYINKPVDGKPTPSKDDLKKQSQISSTALNYWQRTIAQRRLGTITRMTVNKDTGDTTWYGLTYEKYTFPKGGLAYNASMPGYYGGLPSKERPYQPPIDFTEQRPVKFTGESQAQRALALAYISTNTGGRFRDLAASRLLESRRQLAMDQNTSTWIGFYKISGRMGPPPYEDDFMLMREKLEGYTNPLLAQVKSNFPAYSVMDKRFNIESEASRSFSDAATGSNRLTGRALRDKAGAFLSELEISSEQSAREYAKKGFGFDTAASSIKFVGAYALGSAGKMLLYPGETVKGVALHLATPFRFAMNPPRVIGEGKELFESIITEPVKTGSKYFGMRGLFKGASLTKEALTFTEVEVIGKGYVWKTSERITTAQKGESNIGYLSRELGIRWIDTSKGSGFVKEYPKPRVETRRTIDRSGVAHITITKSFLGLTERKTQGTIFYGGRVYKGVFTLNDAGTRWLRIEKRLGHQWKATEYRESMGIFGSQKEIWTGKTRTFKADKGIPLKRGVVTPGLIYEPAIFSAKSETGQVNLIGLQGTYYYKTLGESRRLGRQYRKDLQSVSVFDQRQIDTATMATELIKERGKTKINIMGGRIYYSFEDFVPPNYRRVFTAGEAMGTRGTERMRIVYSKGTQYIRTPELSSYSVSFSKTRTTSVAAKGRFKPLEDIFYTVQSLGKRGEVRFSLERDLIKRSRVSARLGKDRTSRREAIAPEKLFNIPLPKGKSLPGIKSSAAARSNVRQNNEDKSKTYMKEVSKTNVRPSFINKIISRNKINIDLTNFTKVFNRAGQTTIPRLDISLRMKLTESIGIKNPWGFGFIGGPPPPPPPTPIVPFFSQYSGKGGKRSRSGATRDRMTKYMPSLYGITSQLSKKYNPAILTGIEPRGI